MHALPPHPNLDQLKRQAKELRGAYNAGQPEALARLQPHLRQATSPTQLSCRDAQQIVARQYGFAAWATLKEHVETRLALQAHTDERPLGQPHSREIFRTLARQNYQLSESDHKRRSRKTRLGVCAHGAAQATRLCDQFGLRFGTD
jgi:hypothetical protein